VVQPPARASKAKTLALGSTYLRAIRGGQSWPRRAPPTAGPSVKEGRSSYDDAVGKLATQVEHPAPDDQLIGCVGSEPAAAWSGVTRRATSW